MNSENLTKTPDAVELPAMPLRVALVLHQACSKPLVDVDMMHELWWVRRNPMWWKPMRKSLRERLDARE